MRPVSRRAIRAAHFATSALTWLTTSGVARPRVNASSASHCHSRTASTPTIGPNATALALADHPRTAGSASALLGTIQFVIGALVAPLVGLAGTGTALPLAVIIALCEGGALLAFVLLTPRK